MFYSFFLFLQKDKYGRKEGRMVGWLTVKLGCGARKLWPLFSCERETNQLFL